MACIKYFTVIQSVTAISKGVELLTLRLQVGWGALATCSPNSVTGQMLPPHSLPSPSRFGPSVMYMYMYILFHIIFFIFNSLALISEGIHHIPAWSRALYFSLVQPQSPALFCTRWPKTLPLNLPHIISYHCSAP